MGFVVDTTKVFEPDPADHWTVATKYWAGVAVLIVVGEAAGLWVDHEHPGNRGKWTITSNVRPTFGFDSVTGLPIRVRFGAARRTALVLLLAWMGHHFTNKRGTF